MSNQRSPSAPLDAVIVGAGFAGLRALHTLRERDYSVRVFERGRDVGGVWYWNRYPGCRCDTDSVEYSYGFSESLQQEWTWTERFASQPEILRYARHVADRFDLRKDIRFGVSVVSATFDEAAAQWMIDTDDGETTAARHLVLCVGCLSSASLPSFPGRDAFAGEVHHTGHWPAEGVELAGKRVGVIGTGSSGVQAIPPIAERAASLTVFQRTPTYTVPARNRPLDGDEVRRVKADYAGFRKRNRRMAGAAGADHFVPEPVSVFEATPEAREAAFLKRWNAGGLAITATFDNLRTDLDANAYLTDFMRRQIGKTVNDQDTARKLTPRHIAGCKRMVLDTGYYETFNRDNVTLVDISETPIERFTKDGLTVGAKTYPLDFVVFATGYDAMTGALLAIDIRGRDGRRLRDAWASGPRTYLGLGTAGFPNMFIVTGPGSPSVLTNMIVAIEQHVDWIADCLDHLRREEIATIEPEADAQDSWVEHVNAVAAGTAYTQCDSWYLGANIPGKPRTFMPLIGFPAYEETCERVAGAGYDGFTCRSRIDRAP